jgi:AcrR family transcriptional regulator
LVPADSVHKLEWVRPPLQARSAKTLERLLDAAEALLDHGGPDAITVAEVARRAESSVGAFYARFKDKEGLVQSVLERFNEQALATAEAVLDVRRWQGIRLDAALEALIAFMLRIAHERHGVIRTLTARSAVDPSLRSLGARLHERLTELLLALVAARGETLRHALPEVGMRMAVWTVLSTIESRALYVEAVVERLPDDVVARELTQMVTRYLGIGPTSNSSSPGSSS